MKHWFSGLSWRWRVAITSLAVVLVLGASVNLALVATRSPNRPSPVASPSSSPKETPTTSITPSATASTPSPSPVCAAQPAGSPSTNLPANYATSLAFAPDGRLFYAERGGTIRVVAGGVAQTFATVATVTEEPDGGYSERGLLGIAISPFYATDHFVYAFYSLNDYTHQNVVRWTDCGGTGTAFTTLLSFPSGDDCCHKGGRIGFSSDGKLLVTLGDEHSAMAAQDTSDVRGKVLRYNPDGTIPIDNPFGPSNPVWAYGLRNPFGLAPAPSGEVLITSNGPSGDAGAPGTGYDLAMRVHSGSGHQWPYCYGYSHPISSKSDCHGQPGPQWSSEATTLVPTGAAWVNGNGPAQLAGHFVFCTYSDGMRILDSGSPHDSVRKGPENCKLDVAQAPDHTVFYADESQIYKMT